MIVKTAAVLTCWTTSALNRVAFWTAGCAKKYGMRVACNVLYHIMWYIIVFNKKKKKIVSYDAISFNKVISHYIRINCLSTNRLGLCIHRFISTLVVASKKILITQLKLNVQHINRKTFSATKWSNDLRMSTFSLYIAKG